MDRLHRRPFLLLELLIALALVALVALPLIATHYAVVSAQERFNAEVALDHAVSLLFIDLVEQLHTNAIPSTTIASGEKIPIERGRWGRIGYRSPLPFNGYYSFKETKHKPKEKGHYTLYLYKVTFSFQPSYKGGGKERSFVYDLFLIRHLPEGQETPLIEIEEET